jgi:FkbM family methyltransferase
MSTDGLCEKYRWSSGSEIRNELTARYEPVQPFVLLAMTRRLGDAVFVDAGANTGFYTVIVGSEPSVAEVFAFEPMPKAASAIRWNANANLFDKPVVVREVALSDHHGHLDFAVRSPLAGDNGALQDSILDRGDFEVQRVRCGRLDDELQAAEREVVLKVDVEGHELSFLQGATRTLSDNRGFLQIEMHESPSHSEKLALLNELGWHQVSRVGPDYYFSNIAEFASNDAFRAEILEEAMGILVDVSKSGSRASRRRIAQGVYLQVSRRQVDAIKGILKR